MNWANVKAQIGLGDEGSFFIHFTDDQGDDAYLTVDRQCHVLMVANGLPSHYGDDVTPDAAFELLTGRKAADLREAIPQ